MVSALVSDCNSHLENLEKQRACLETGIADGCAEDDLRQGSQALAKTIHDYKQAAKHCKKHCVKPKAPAKAAAQDP